MSYKKLKIWEVAREIVIEIHHMTLNELPKFEFYEVGSQIRRSSKSVRANIVEGYGRRAYKLEYIRFLIIAQASNDETIDHLETLRETGSLTNTELYNELYLKLNHLGKMLNRFIQTVQNAPASQQQATSDQKPII